MLRMQTALDTPWKVQNELRRLLALPYIRLGFLCHGIEWGRDWRIFGMPVIQKHRGSSISLGEGVELRSWARSNPLLVLHPVVLATRCRRAQIRIGEHCGLSGTTLVAAERISIGNYVFVGSNTTICDTDFHPLDPGARLADPNAGSCKPISIEDDVFIGMNCLVLKGVTIGRGAVVGAGSVVTCDVAPYSIVAGNPARLIREHSRATARS